MYKFNESGWLPAESNAEIRLATSKGGLMDLSQPRIIILHWTAGGDYQQSFDVLEDRGLSAHFIIGRKGEIIQSVSIDMIAFHAGKSHWNGHSYLNNISIGIELANYGPLTYGGLKDGWRTWSGKKIENYNVDPYPVEGVGQGFEKFPQVQIETAISLCRSIHTWYKRKGNGIDDIVTHADVSPRRKIDIVNPAFPIGQFQALLDDAKIEPKWMVTAGHGLNVRNFPDKDSNVITTLNAGDKVYEIAEHGDWIQVDISMDGCADGWVHKSYMRRL